MQARGPEWRARIRLAALDPFRGYLNALRTHLPAATHVVDVFHVVKLGFDALDDVRRRVQQEQTGHRGRTGDPLYATRRLLRRRGDRLKPRHIDRLNTALTTGDPIGEVTIAWHAAQALAGAMARTDRNAGAAAAEAVIATYIDCPVPEVARLARTLRTWRPATPRLLRRSPDLQRPDRSDQPAHRESPPRRPRLPTIRKLPPTPTTPLRSHLGYGLDNTDQDPSTTPGCVEPVYVPSGRTSTSGNSSWVGARHTSAAPDASA